MRKSFPVEDLARDERFVRVADDRAVHRPAAPRRSRPARAQARGPAASPPTAPTRPTPPAR